MILKDEKSQLEARDYVLNRPLPKPSTTVIVPILFILGIIACGTALGFIILILIQSYSFASNINKVLLILGTIGFLFVCMIKPLLIICIKCYQHYASENIRRSCMCKPTCSEYAIIVIKRYCLIKALILIYIRLFRTCTGRIYKIDFPYK